MVGFYRNKIIVPGGRGRLTIARIDSMQNFYGQSIRKNKGDVDKMVEATQALLSHYSDTDHKFCQKGKDSWCSFQRYIITRKHKHRPIKNPLPKSVKDVIQPLFNRLGSREFLSGCVKYRTQNINEFYHNVIWSLAPKSKHTGPLETKLAVGLRTLLFNVGFKSSFQSICYDVGINDTENMLEQLEVMDNEKIYNEHRQAQKKFKLRLEKLFSKLLKGNTPPLPSPPPVLKVS